MPKIQKRLHAANGTHWDDHCLPKANQSIAKVMRYEGNNIHQVLTPTGEKYLVSMPTKFIRYTWVKRGSYVLVEAIAEAAKVRGEVIKVMDEHSITFYKHNNVWPKEFEDKKEKSVPGDAKLLENNDKTQPKISENVLLLLRALDTNKKFFSDDSK